MSSSLGIVADIIAIITAIAAVISAVQATRLRQQQVREQRQRDERIKIILTAGNRQLELPWAIRRETLTRAEVGGLLGMLPIDPSKAIGEGKQPRYQIKYLSTRAFMEQIEEIAVGKRGGALLISCDESEID